MLITKRNFKVHLITMLVFVFLLAVLIPVNAESSKHPYQYKFEELLVLEEDFSDPESGWEYSDEEQSSQYQDGSLVFTNRKPKTYKGCTIVDEATKNHLAANSNYAVQVELQLADKAIVDGLAGIMLRNDDTNSGYLFAIDPQKQIYRLTYYKQEKSNYIFSLKSKAVNSGIQKNILRVEKIQDELLFFINGQFVGKYVLKPEEKVFNKLGLVVYADRLPASFRYDNFKVFQLQTAKLALNQGLNSLITIGPQNKVFKDNFNSPHSGWLIVVSDDLIQQYNKNRLEVSLNDNSMFNNSNLRLRIAEPYFSVQAEMGILDGSDSQYGLKIYDGVTGYTFVVNPFLRQYCLLKNKEEVIIGWTKSEFIKKDRAFL